MTIKTVHVCPPIPVRDYDWQAYDLDTYDPESDMPVGWGRTEAEAITDLFAQLDERAEIIMPTVEQYVAAALARKEGRS